MRFSRCWISKRLCRPESLNESERTLSILMYGLIFDVDGVLADTEGPIAEATIRMFRDLYDTEMEAADFAPFIGTGAVRYVEGPAEKYGLDIDIDKAIAARHRNFTDIITSRDIATPGSHELIAAVADAPEWKLGIATSSPGEKSRVTLDAAGIDTRLFDAWIHGDMITRKKPDPEIYLKAAAAMDLPPARCVVVEDAVTGAAAGKAAGMRVVAVTGSFTAEELAEADHIIDSLAEVTLDILQRMVG
jgi:HAD superfamily hydrolase (TIGR01509 family)